MESNYRKLRNDRQWRSTTGMSEEQFEILSNQYAKSYYSIYGKTMEQRQSESSEEARFKRESDLLFFVLFCLKTGLTQDVIGFVFEIDGSTVSRNRRFGVRLLQAALHNLGVYPKREFVNVEEFEAYFKKHPKLLIDGTEQAVQRPKNGERQKEMYSGKKCHTVKTVVISTPNRYIHYVSEGYIGKAHDFSILKAEFEPHQGWFKAHEIEVDLGYIGFDKNYECKQLNIPHKKKKN